MSFPIDTSWISASQVRIFYRTFAKYGPRRPSRLIKSRVSEVIRNSTPNASILAPSIDEPASVADQSPLLPEVQSLLREHKAQIEIVSAIMDELRQLKQDPKTFFLDRKMFLIQAYNQNLNKCTKKLKFDVKVYLSHDKTNG